MLIKVCGIKQADNARAIELLVPDMMGFIFYTKSPRYVGIEPESAPFENKHKAIRKVGVFVNESDETMITLIDKFRLDYVQLHGNETPEICSTMKLYSQVIKAFGISSDFNFDSLSMFEGTCDYYLFDTKTDGYGGSGNRFEWSVLDQYKLNTPFILSGGVGEENIADIDRLNHPMFSGIDLNSKFEISPGLKDVKKLSDFISKIRKHNKIP